MVRVDSGVGERVANCLSIRHKFSRFSIAHSGQDFKGMELAGIILISVGFFLVMFPNNWPDYITRLLRLVMCHCNCLLYRFSLVFLSDEKLKRK